MRFCRAMCRTARSTEPGGPRSARLGPITCATTAVCSAQSETNMHAVVALICASWNICFHHVTQFHRQKPTCCSSQWSEIAGVHIPSACSQTVQTGQQMSPPNPTSPSGRGAEWQTHDQVLAAPRPPWSVLVRGRKRGRMDRRWERGGGAEGGV